VIGGEDHDRVLVQTTFDETIQQTTQALVEGTDVRVVPGQITSIFWHI
tara:strand:+ start:377 stop:520 length:144 start_codon:yes stop_codon:yes gene_type:complete